MTLRHAAARLITAVGVILVTACAGHAQPDDSGAVPPTADAHAPGWTADTIHIDDVRKLLMAIGVQQFFAAVSVPSPYMTDAFGIQDLKPVSRAMVRADFVPKYATIVADSPNALSLQFRNGPRVDFRYRTVLYVDQRPIPVPFAVVHYDEPANYFAAVRGFHDILIAAGLADKYLPLNPYYELEQYAKALIDRKATLPEIPSSTDMAAFHRASHAILLIGDLHGSWEHYKRAQSQIGTPGADWVGFEMLTENLQDAARIFTDADTASDAYRRARQQLIAGVWPSRFPDAPKDPEHNPYFELVDLARRTGKRIIAFDASYAYSLFRFGEFPLGVMTRNCVWATHVPLTGRGIIFGGASHFMIMPTFQTCLRGRDPNVQFFELPRPAADTSPSGGAH